MTTQTQTTVEAPITATVDYKLEVAVIPVSDVDRAKAFYEQVGFHVDNDAVVNDDLRLCRSRHLARRARSRSGKG